MTGLGVTSWSQGGQDRIDVFWREPGNSIAHLGGDGTKWSSSAPLGGHDNLGGRFVTAPVAL